MGIKAIAALAVTAIALAGCGAGTWKVNYDSPVSRNISQSWDVVDVRVAVPDELTTSDVNSLAPNFDIVWHGEPFGNRRAQVARILDEGITRGAAGLNGPRPVFFQVTLQHFHSVTPNAVARSPGAVHNITYALQVFDAKTGRAITRPQRIDADLQAYVGTSATLAAREGRGQRVRIVDHLAKVTRSWLSVGPDIRATFSGTGA